MQTINGKYSFNVGESFYSYDDLQNRMASHSAESFVYYWRRDTRTVQGAFTKTSRQISQNLKYYSVRYACVYGGQKFRSRSQGRRNTQTMRTNCPAFIMLRASKCGQKLEVIAVCNDHNHEISKDASKCLPQNRKLPDEIRDEVLKMMTEQIDRRSIIEYIQQKTDKRVTHKDLHNLKAAHKHIFAAPEKPDEHQSILYDDDHEITKATFDENSVVIEWGSEFLCDKELDKDILQEGMEINDSAEIQHNDENIANENHYQNGMEDDQNLSGNTPTETTFSPDNEILDQTEIYDTSYYVIEEPYIIVNESDESNGNDNIVNPDTYDQPADSDDFKIDQKFTQTDEKRQVTRKYFTRNRELIRRRRRNYQGLQRKSFHCSHCGSYAKLIKMQIEVLKAQKQKLLQETHILQLTKEKLLYNVRELEQKQ